MKPGLFIVLEGSDGSGKATQLKLLTERLRAAGHVVDVYDFPRYEEASSHFVRKYLNGEYGPASEISPYTASLFYALDRYEASPLIRQSLADGKIVLANRYVGSNMAHQGSKFTNSGEQRGFFVWADSLEFQLLGIPRPNLNIFLRVPAAVSYELIKQKKGRSYTNKTHDEHEADINHLSRSVKTYDTMCQLFPKDFKAIECAEDGKLLSITEINNRIWEILRPLLPVPAKRGRAAVVSLQEEERPKLSESRQTDVHKNNLITSENASVTHLKDISLLAARLINGAPGISTGVSYNWPATGAKPRLHYYIPSQFPANLTKKYRSKLDAMSNLYVKMQKIAGKGTENNKKTDNETVGRLLRAAIPMAALTNVVIKGDEKSVQAALLHSLTSQLPELRQITAKIIAIGGNQAAANEPTELKQIVKQLSESHQPQVAFEHDQLVKLLDARPRNEFDLLADYLYRYSDLAKQNIDMEIENWSYEQKSSALQAAYRQTGYQAIAATHYTFDIIADNLLMQNLIGLIKPTHVRVQPPTPRYGYDVPEEISRLGIEDEFIQCFDISLELFSDIQAAGYGQLAGYATLLGHRSRWQFGLDGPQLFSFQAPNERLGNLLLALREKVAEYHPLIVEIYAQDSAKPPLGAKSPLNETNPTLKNRKKSTGRSKK